jgi:hypothetical protein
MILEKSMIDKNDFIYKYFIQRILENGQEYLIKELKRPKNKKSMINLFEVIYEDIKDKIDLDKEYILKSIK